MATKKAKFVVYRNSDEVFVALLKDEAKLRKTWFGKTSGRGVDQYDRDEVSEDTVQIESALQLRVGNRDF